MQCSTLQGPNFCKMLDHVKNQSTRVNVKFSPEGMELATLDPSHIAMVKVLIKSTGFETYECKREVVIAVNMAAWHFYVHNSSNHDILEMSLPDLSPDIMHVCLSNA
jgi:proliferating cell nuclear antigen